MSKLNRVWTGCSFGVHVKDRTIKSHARLCFFRNFPGLLRPAGRGAGPVEAQPYGPPPYRDARAIATACSRWTGCCPASGAQHPGDFYDAEGPTYGPSGDPHYHLKWMTPDGRVIWYDTDARNGRVLRSSPGRDSFDNSSRRRSTARLWPALCAAAGYRVVTAAIRGTTRRSWLWLAAMARRAIMRSAVPAMLGRLALAAVVAAAARR